MTLASILVAVDLSPAALAAARRAPALAGARGTIRLLHVIRASPVVYARGPVLEQLEQDLARGAREKLEGLAEELRGLGAKRVELEVVRGRPADEILAAAERHGADLVLIGAHARGAIGRLVLGSVSEEVVRASAVPTLVVREPTPEKRGKSRRTAPSSGVVKRLLVAVDHSPPSRAAAAVALGIAERLEVPLEAVHVVELPHVPDYLQHEAGGGKWRELEDGVCPLPRELEKALGKKLPVRFVVGTDPAREVVRVAGPEDLIVCGTHARGALGRTVFGSVATKILRKAPCPVLVVRPGATVPGGTTVGRCIIE